MNTVNDLMTENPLTVHPATALVDAVKLLTEKKLNSVAVVDDKNIFVGMVNERDLITDSSFVNLETLLKLINGVNFYKKDRTPIQEDLKKILSLKVSDIMNMGVPTLQADSQIEEASKIFGDPKINSIPVLNKDRKLIGMLSLTDLTKLYGTPLRRTSAHEQVDEQIDKFVKDFEKQFLFVSRFHAQTWLITSIMFGIVGFIISLMFILRITKN